jgi:hypothetical protein
VKNPLMIAAYSVLVFACCSPSIAELAGDYLFVGYQISFDGGGDLGFGNQKIILADLGDVTVSNQDLFSGTITGREIIRQISNLEVNTDGEKRYFSSFSVTGEDVVESIEGSAVLEGQLVMRVDDGEGSFPFYFNTTTNVALAFQGVDGEQSSPDLGLGLLIRKGSGMGNANAQGTYAGYSFGNEFDSQDLSSGTGNVDRLSLSTISIAFDGAGLFTGTADEWEMSRTLSDQEITEGDDRYIDTIASYATYTNSIPLAGTYSLSDDGAMLVVEGEDVMPLQVSADANLAASALGGDQEAFFLMFIKQPTNMPSAVSNVFYFAELSENVGQWDPSGFMDETECYRNYLFLKPDHTFAMRSDSWGAQNRLSNFREVIEEPSRKISRNMFSTEVPEKRVGFESGTYSIAPNGVATLNFQNGETGMGQISENGEYLLVAFSGEEDALNYTCSIIFGIHREPPAGSQPVSLAIQPAPAGVEIEVTSAMGTAFEALYTGNLAEGDWRSAGIYTNESGSMVIPDTSATNETQRFYMTTFPAW